MIKCLIVDDKPLAIDVLKHYISQVPFLEMTFATVNPIEALQKVLEAEVDLVFLDIQMPELNGLEFMRMVKGKCSVILTTAYSEYALEGFEHDAVDYLLKPVSFERFLKAAEKIQVIVNRLNAQANPSEDKQKESIPEAIFVKTEYRIVRISLVDIIYIEAMQNYIVIHTYDEKILSLQTMAKIQSQLSRKQFIRVHKSFIISINKITSIERNRIHIGNTSISLGETYKEAFYRTIDHR